MGNELRDLIQRQVEFSSRAFGPEDRREGILKHLAEELDEVRAAAANGEETLPEWVDVILLGLDGAWRSLIEELEDPKILNRAYFAYRIEKAINDKLSVNEGRNWPDYRERSTDEAIGHSDAGVTLFQILYPEKKSIAELTEIFKKWIAEEEQRRIRRPSLRVGAAASRVWAERAAEDMRAFLARYPGVVYVDPLAFFAGVLASDPKRYGPLGTRPEREVIDILVAQNYLIEQGTPFGGTGTYRAGEALLELVRADLARRGESNGEARDEE